MPGPCESYSSKTGKAYLQYLPGVVNARVRPGVGVHCWMFSDLKLPLCISLPANNWLFKGPGMPAVPRLSLRGVGLAWYVALVVSQARPFTYNDWGIGSGTLL